RISPNRLLRRPGDISPTPAPIEILHEADRVADTEVDRVFRRGEFQDARPTAVRLAEHGLQFLPALHALTLRVNERSPGRKILNLASRHSTAPTRKHEPYLTCGPDYASCRCTTNFTPRLRVAAWHSAITASARGWIRWSQLNMMQVLLRGG